MPRLPTPSASAADGITTPSAPSPADLDQARSLMREVCALASTAMDLSSGDPVPLPDEDSHDGADSLQTRLHLLRLVVDRIGWVADVSLRKLGDRGCLACAEDWMLPGH